MSGVEFGLMRATCFSLFFGLVLAPIGLWAQGAPEDAGEAGAAEKKEVKRPVKIGGDEYRFGAIRFNKKSREIRFAAAVIQDDEFVPFTADELQEIVGPVALYPDSLLGHVLAASTLPEEIGKAVARLDETDGEFDDEDPVFAELDPHVQSLLPFRDVLDMMQEYADWTSELGSAMAAQEAELIDAVQAFRQRVDEAGNLEDSEQQVIVREQQIIKIQA